jgi:hypothetical protein
MKFMGFVDLWVRKNHPKCIITQSDYTEREFKMAKKEPKSQRGHGLDTNGRSFCRAKTWSRSARDVSPKKDRRETKNTIRKQEDDEK